MEDFTIEVFARGMAGLVVGVYFVSKFRILESKLDAVLRELRGRDSK